ncbi:MAG: hypothetical protein ACLP6E_04975 [Acidimicrobiales bacterium]
MARQDAGKWVARAGATGGGRSYRARVPYRWYSGLALIVVLGVFLVAYSRYERLHPAAAVQPTTSSHWAAGVVFDLCGKNNQVLAASSAADQATLGLYSSGDGVIEIQPKTSADTGTNATLGRFTSQFSGLTLTSTSVGLPKQHVYNDGSKCPAGTPDAGKTGQLIAKIVPPAQSNQSSTTQTGDLRTVRFTTNGEIVIVAFVPNGANIPGPSATITAAVEDAVAAAASTSTTTPATVPAITSTTKPGSTTTTTKGSKSTVPKVTTTTTGSTTTSTSAGTTTTSG